MTLEELLKSHRELCEIENCSNARLGVHARELLPRYIELQQDANKCLDKLFEHFADIPELKESAKVAKAEMKSRHLKILRGEK